MEKEALKKRIEVAAGRLPADVVIKHCNLVDVYTGTKSAIRIYFWLSRQRAQSGIQEGGVSGEFQTDYPEEMAEMIYAASQSIVVWLEKNSSSEKIAREVDALSFLVRQCLNMDEERTKRFETHLKQQVQNVLQQ